ncbi:MAG: RdgB/HAM1 family non-canonical purine NTP pyrophosphatase [Myxococcales bacterium]|nr:RdgB/HAM1 family non-canonical purine NTP pyrophosphatase [Myxococcales bacterium]
MIDARAGAPVLSVVVATTNRGKLAELRAMLATWPVELLSLSDALGVFVIEEDALTFAGNAKKKAELVAAECHAVVIADDSGLEVDALGGGPGVRSARFARAGATDAENNAELLRRLVGVETSERTARFRCALALVDPWAAPGARLFECDGCCEGRIAEKPSGKGGFGYDPLFIVAGGNSTFAELDQTEKNRISHRAVAFARVMPQLERIVVSRTRQALTALAGPGSARV